MATYEFRCDTCGGIFKIIQSIHDKTPQSLTCHCGGIASRIFHAAPVAFKGSGFYKTDKDQRQ